MDQTVRVRMHIPFHRPREDVILYSGGFTPRIIDRCSLMSFEIMSFPPKERPRNNGYEFLVPSVEWNTMFFRLIGSERVCRLNHLVHTCTSN